MSQTPYVVLAIFHALPGKEQALREILTSLVAPTLKEEGCIIYYFHESLDTPGHFMFYENWSNQAALAKHLESPHIKNWKKQMPDLVMVPFEVSFWKRL